MTILDEETMPRLMERLQRLRADSRPGWGRMNAHQMVCHLNDAMKLAFGEREFAEASPVRFAGFFRFVAFRLPAPWPKNYPTRPEFDQEKGGTAPKDFGLDTAALGAALERLSHGRRDFRFGRHPVFGELTEWEWKRWAYLHADHHFRQFGV
ncbi:MAG: DUF1569 domain-containing protein [Bryobacterales bacterium]|nr:DUF1569 domain-containing protein [Bryobacterales bacterium]